MSQPILSLTSAACQHIAQMLEKQEGKTVFSLSVKKTGCNGYMYVPELLSGIGDNALEIDALNAPFRVCVSRDAVAVVSGTVMDFELKSFGMKQLTFNNPNAQGLCGCGESFNLKQEVDQ